MPRCIALGCTSGYDTNFDKVHFFTVPKKSDVITLWQAALRRPNFVIKSRQAVCEKHFAKEDILYFKEFRSPEGIIIGRGPYKRPQLRKGAVPSIFPCTKTVTTSESSTTCSTKLANLEKNQDEDLDNNRNSECVSQNESTRSTLLSGYNPSSLLSQSEETCEDSSSFWKLLDNDSLCLPPSWSKHTDTCGEIAVSSFTLSTCIKVNGVYMPLILKRLLIQPNMEAHVQVLGKLIDLTPIGVPKVINSKEELENTLSFLHSLTICCGSPLPDDLQKLRSKIIYKDLRGSFRHINCTMLTSSVQCSSCSKVKNTLSRQKYRLVKIEKRKTKSIHLTNLSQEHRKSLKKLRHIIHKERARNEQTQAKIRGLRAQLKDCQGKMAKISKDSITDRVKHLPKNQVNALHEILAASKCKSYNGRRYSEDWMMLCLLLHMRSASGYNFIRDNNILPLPTTRTIRRNLAIINTTCEFDPNFLQVMGKFLAGKEEIQKHGILLLDEMSTRESLGVNSKTLPYTGLVDFGDEKHSTNLEDKANYGLVLMFQPLADSYTQPITVFASRGATDGTLLAQLILKAIILMEKAGAKIHGVVSDGAGPNRKFWSEFGINGKRHSLKSSFEHPLTPDRHVYVFSDTPHLIKTIRNRFHKKLVLQLDCNQPKIKWEYLTILYDKDSALPEKLRVCPKLSSNHLNLNNSLKMRVRLAVQILSKSTANALRYYKTYIPELQDSEQTALFCEWMNDLFDALNRTCPTQGLIPGNNDFQLIASSLNRLNAWEDQVINGLLHEDFFLTRQTAEGLRVTLRSTLDLVTYLTTIGFSNVLTGRINQDALERFFGTVRQAGGCNDHPNTPTFL